VNPEQDKADPSHSSALLIGGHTYPRLGLPPVLAAAENVARLKAEFLAHDLWGLPRARVTAEVDLTKADLLDAVGTGYRSSDRTGLFVLYFVGHAHEQDGVLYLAAYDSTDVTNPQGSMVSIDQVFEAVRLQGRHAEKKLLILDCCYAGRAIRSVPAEPVRAGKKSGWYVMAATSEEDTALGDPARDTTFFTGALLKAFEGVEEARPSLSPRWVFETVSTLVENSPDADGTKLVPQTNGADWADMPWLGNRNRLKVEPPRLPHNYPSVGAEVLATSQSRPSGFSSWPQAERDFAGRVDELKSAHGRFRQRVVLPVQGPRYAGKSAFVRQLLAETGLRESAPIDRPWLLLEITIINAGAEAPVLEALARALDVRLHDVNAAPDVDGDPRLESMIDRLRDHARGRTLLTIVDCGRLGYDSQRISGELDALLAHPYFRDTANIVISRVPVTARGDDQLDLQVPVRLQELEQDEAARLLTSLLAHENTAVNGDEVLAHIRDSRLRLPGVLIPSAKGYLSGVDRIGTAPDPSEIAAALLQGSTPSVARTLLELGCQMTTTWAPGGRLEPLAVLVVWALSDQLELPRHVLENPEVGLTPRLLSLLKDARILFTTETGGLVLGQASEQALRSMLIAAVTRGENEADPFNQPVLGTALIDQLFPPELGVPELECRLLAAASPLLVIAAGALDSDDELADSAFQRKLRAVLGWIEDDGRKLLPNLHSTISSLVVAPAGDLLYLPALATQLISSSTVEHPVTATLEQTAEDQLDLPAITPLAALYRLYNALAALTLASRVEGSAAATGARFLSAAEEFSGALAQCEPGQVTHTLLRSADASLALAGRRLGLKSHLINTRLSAVEALLTGARQRGPGQAGRISLAISWLLNTADVLIDIDRLDEAQGLAETANALLTDSLPDDNSVTSTYARLQFGSRMSQVQSRLLRDPRESRRELVTAVGNVAAGLVLTHETGSPLLLWSTRLFDVANLLIQQCANDEELIESKKMVMTPVEKCWGPQNTWPQNIRISAARFLRRAYVRCADTDIKMNGAKEVIDLLVDHPTVSASQNWSAGYEPNLPASLTGDDEVISLDDRDTSQMLCALAQAYGFHARALSDAQRQNSARARLTKAEEVARAAVRLAPTTFSYSVWLRQVIDTKRITPRTGKKADEVEKMRKSCIKTVQTWLSHRSTPLHAYALLDLACLESEWQERGSLRVAAQEPNEDFLFLAPAVQRDRIEKIYNEREHRLKAHRRRFGPSVELSVLETRLRREHCRWKGALNFKVAKLEHKRNRGPQPASRTPQVDNSPVFEIFADGSRRWPGDARLLAAEAEFHRYIWSHRKSIELYELLARTAPNGETRKYARLYAAEAIIAEVEDIPLSRIADRQTELIVARDHLNVVLASSQSTGLAAILRERVAIRLNEPVVWSTIDNAFENIIGGDYTGTIGRFLNHRHYGAEKGLESIGDRLRNVDRGSSALMSGWLQELVAEYADADSNPAEVVMSIANTTIPQPGIVNTFAAEEDPGQSTSNLLGELLLSDFTSVQLVGGLGLLYLDRAFDLIRQHHAEADGALLDPDSDLAVEVALQARRAYDCFDACRVLQEANRAESIVTKFHRGRAVTLAARVLQNPDPFPQEVLQGSGHQLGEAFKMLLTAREHSVAGFNVVCSAAVRQNNETQVLLGLRKPRFQS
jgi:Caspase domain